MKHEKFLTANASTATAAKLRTGPAKRGAGVIGGLLATAVAQALAPTASAAQDPDRTVLPLAEPKRPTYTEFDARNVKAPPRFEVKAPEGAPNVVIVLIDDLGFGDTSDFGGPVPTQVLDRLAAEGLRYNNFHTTALSSPTRAALKSGRNHQTVNMGFITDLWCSWCHPPVLPERPSERIGGES